MLVDLKDINIGNLIRKGVEESGISEQRISNFFRKNTAEIEEMYNSISLDTDMLLKWSKLLEYDFFRVYSQHLILFAPAGAKEQKLKKTRLPQFRKNIYTKEIIAFILELVHSGEKTKLQIIEEYKIPKTTLYKWISKYTN